MSFTSRADNTTDRPWFKKHKQGWLKRTFAFSTAIAAGAVVYACAPDFEFDDDRDYGPTDFQTEFLTQVARNHTYMALGDTDHRKMGVRLFVYDPETVEAVADGGKKYFFTESPPQKQFYYDALNTGLLPKGTLKRGMADSNMWICSQEAKDRLNETFETSATSVDEVRFIGADMRHAAGGSSADITEDEAKLLNMTVHRPLRLYKWYYGCIDSEAFIIPSILTYVFGGSALSDKLNQALLDDRDTADYIGSYEDGGVIFFGAGHFKETRDTAGQPLDMLSILSKNGDTVASIGIFENEEHRADFYKKHEVYFDALVFIDAPDYAPYGVQVINCDLQDEFETAFKALGHHSRPQALPDSIMKTSDKGGLFAPGYESPTV